MPSRGKKLTKLPTHGVRTTKQFCRKYGIHLNKEAAEAVVDRKFMRGVELDIVDLGGRFGLKLSKTQNAVPILKGIGDPSIPRDNLTRVYPKPKGMRRGRRNGRQTTN